MNCDELKAKLDSQKAALLRIEAQEIADTASNGSYLYAEYLAAKSEYESAARQLAALTRGVRG